MDEPGEAVRFQVVHTAESTQPRSDERAGVSPRQAGSPFLALFRDSFRTPGSMVLLVGLLAPALAAGMWLVGDWGWGAVLASGLLVGPALGCALLAPSIGEDAQSGFLDGVLTQPVHAALVPACRLTAGFTAMLAPVVLVLVADLAFGAGFPSLGRLAWLGPAVVATMAGLATLLSLVLPRPGAAAGAWVGLLLVSAVVAFLYLVRPPETLLGLRLMHATPALFWLEGLAVLPSPWTTPVVVPIVAQAVGMIAVTVGFARWGWDPIEPRPLPAIVAVGLVAVGLVATPFLLDIPAA